MRRRKRLRRLERLEARTLLTAAGLIPVSTSVSVQDDADGLLIDGTANLQFSAVVLHPELNGPEDVSLTGVQISSSGQLNGQVEGFDVSGSYQTDEATPELSVTTGANPNLLSVESVAPDHIPGTFEATINGLPVQDGEFTATLETEIDLSTLDLTGTLTIDLSGNFAGSPFARTAQAPISQEGVIPPGTEIPDPTLRSVSGRVFLDGDGDGVRDAGDGPLGGVTAVLVQDSTVVDSMEVDSQGHYSFYNLAAGDYEIQFEGVPSGYEFTTQNAGAAEVDSDVDPASGSTGSLDFAASDHLLNIDAGLRLNADDVAAAADTIGVYQPDVSLFHLKESFTPGASDEYFAFGPTGDAGWVPLSGDWNGDGLETIGLYQPDISLFHLKDSFTPGASDQYFAFGPAGDAGWIPLSGDWDGDGVDTIGLYQPDISLFHLKDSFTPGASDQYFAFGPGGAGWTPLVGDWDGDGVDTVGLYQTDISLFHLKDSFTPGAADHYFAFGPGGNAGWDPLAGDWDGDGIDTIGLYQPDASLFHLKNSLTPGASDRYFAFGPAGADWTPLVGDWNGPSNPAASSAETGTASSDAIISSGFTMTNTLVTFDPSLESSTLASESVGEGERLPAATQAPLEQSSDRWSDEDEENDKASSELRLLDEAFGSWPA